MLTDVFLNEQIISQPFVIYDKLYQ